MNNKRTRFQQGSLTTEKRKKDTLWVFRWRETNAKGTTVRRKRVIGTRAQFPTRSTALREVQALQLDINAQSIVAGRSSMTVDQLIDHYRETELGEANSKTKLTKRVYTDQLVRVISPKWGSLLLQDVKPVAVERWLSTLPVAPATKAKTRAVFGSLFKHAMRHEWIMSNPIQLVRQSALPVREKSVLTPLEIQALLEELTEPFRTLLLLAATTGMRRGELFGLKWKDIDFANGEIRIERSLVDQYEGLPKTLASRKPVPMSSEMAKALQAWQKQTSYANPENWVFASPQALGKKPYWPGAVMKRHVLPAGQRTGITKRIGWHTFRHTYATLLIASGASMKTTQELLRHASPSITMGLYAKAIGEDKRNAQQEIENLLRGCALPTAA